MSGLLKHGTKHQLHRLARLALATVLLSTSIALAQTGTNTVYLFSTFKEPEQDGLRFAYSLDAYHWSNVPGLFLKARVGSGQIMRDPSLARGPDDTYHLVWTCGWRGDRGFGYAHSKDLVHWSEQRFIPRNGPAAGLGGLGSGQ